MPALTISALPHLPKPAGATSPVKPLSGRSSEHHSSAPPSSRGSGRSAAKSEEAARQKASPGALLRLQSASTHPAPHPLPELMRLTAGRHLVPMARIIDSMASLSRAGREHSQRKPNQDSCFAFRQYVQPYQAIAGVLDGHGPNGALVSAFIKQQLPVLVADHLRQRGEVAAGELSRIQASGGRVERLSDAYGREVGPHRVWLPGAWVPGLAMSRAMGDLVAHSVGVVAEPEVHCCEMEAGDEFLVVASDGVWEFMSVQEAAEIVGKCATAEDACRAVSLLAQRESALSLFEGVCLPVSAEGRIHETIA